MQMNYGRKHTTRARKHIPQIKTGTHRLIFDAWQLLTGFQGRFQGVELQSSAEKAMAPSYIYEVRGSI